ncbi:hypothetical protein, partial [Metamycoplasma equirhinis]|uniref:hypothetical protein n=1 Tax=Metamycoplasma equirhinis TaxID=92402 RepID=UPI003593C64A
SILSGWFLKQSNGFKGGVILLLSTLHSLHILINLFINLHRSNTIIYFNHHKFMKIYQNIFKTNSLPIFNYQKENICKII